MRHKIKAKAIEIANNPKTKEAILSMKPKKNFWGIAGTILFFIVPEIIAYIWGAEITQFAKAQLAVSQPLLDEQYYKLLAMAFEDGMSWFNLLVGFALLVWLFF